MSTNIDQLQKPLKESSKKDIEKNENVNKCDKCSYLVDVFGNFVQCVKTGRFVTYEYWNNIHPKDCPFNSVKD